MICDWTTFDWVMSVVRARLDVNVAVRTSDDTVPISSSPAEKRQAQYEQHYYLVVAHMHWQEWAVLCVSAIASLGREETCAAISAK